MLELIISSLYLILPAYVANSAPVISGALRLPLGQPISKKHLGSHKTRRGIYSAYLGALAALALQKHLLANNLPENIQLLEYSEINVYLFALPLGLGAILGDSVKSYLKRKLGKKTGSSWFPFDQLDFILGAYITLFPLFIIPFPNLLTIFLITPILHLLTNITAYKLGLKNVWW